MTGHSIGELWELAKNAGPFGAALLLYLWHRTDRERLNLQRERDALLERTLAALNAASQSISAINDLVRESLRRRNEQSQ